MKNIEIVKGSLSPLGWALPKKHKEPKRNFNGLKEKPSLFHEC
jgi:hypothetical protein